MLFKNLIPHILRGRNQMSHIGDMHRLQHKIDRMFDDFFNAPFGSSLLQSGLSDYIPACDVDETDSHYLINLDLPGVNKDDVKINIKDNQLIISGERKEETKKRHGRERYYGSFTRSFTLPSSIEAEEIEANYENGVLQITIPKTEISSGKEIPINEGKALNIKTQQEKNEKE